MLDRRHSRPFAIAATAAMLALGLAACGGNSGGSDSGTGSSGSGSADSGSGAPAATTPSATATGGAGKAAATPITAKGKTYDVTVTKITDPADAKAPWGGGGTQTHYVALELTLKQTVAAAPGAVNSACFTATDSDGKPAKVRSGYSADGGTPISGNLTQGSPVSGQLIVEVPEGGSLKSITAACDNTSQDKVQLSVR